ncbi:MAG: sulfite exporter TauE/SafE family protein, partial [Flavobacteriales bacterium]|nr:sulfite exporter TauE/SafE family protein [Flavobacteriales bacterium]
VLIVLAEGLIVGGLTGLVGAGGGFLIIPALVLFAGLKMKTAIGTSLIIISAKSLIGFLGDVSNYDVDWSLLIIFSVLAIGGIFIGSFLSTKVDGPKLKKGFGWFVLIMGASILLKEILA